ncbi:hypothetical protein ACFVTP_26650 [Streptomyces celluloflavus]|uniref:hypothetical protein n=1 Tax=Streptomyces celluloflavus TaxID=58344 RepID=UPI0036D82876
MAAVTMGMGRMDDVFDLDVREAVEVSATSATRNLSTHATARGLSTHGPWGLSTHAGARTLSTHAG